MNLGFLLCGYVNNNFERLLALEMLTELPVRHRHSNVSSYPKDDSIESYFHGMGFKGVNFGLEIQAKEVFNEGARKRVIEDLVGPRGRQFYIKPKDSLSSGFSCGSQSWHEGAPRSFFHQYALLGSIFVTVKTNSAPPMEKYGKPLTDDQRTDFRNWSEAFVRKSISNVYNRDNWTKEKPNYVPLSSVGKITAQKYGMLATVSGKSGLSKVASVSSEIRRDGKVIPLKHFVVAIDGTWYAHKEDIAKF